jgi:hypothetical protein
MIATAIDKPTANVPTNVKANSERSVGSTRICSGDMRLAPSCKSKMGVRKNAGSSDVRAKAASAHARLGLNWLTIG